jgi:hypothetical protein
MLFPGKADSAFFLRRGGCVILIMAAAGIRIYSAFVGALPVPSPKGFGGWRDRDLTI